MKFLITTLLTFLLTVNSTLGQQTHYKTLNVQGVAREYIVYVPAIYDGTKAVPLMLNFHGYTQSGYIQMTQIGDMRSIADTANFILVYPKGTILSSGDPHWKVGSWTTGSGADDLGFVSTLLDTLAANYRLELSRVYSCGYSNGGFFSFELACKLSDKIAGIAAVAATMSVYTYNNCNPTHPTPVLTIHGTSDNVVSYSGITPGGITSQETTLAYWRNVNNTDATANTVDLPDTNGDNFLVNHFSYEGGDNCTSVQHYKANGDGHIWQTRANNNDMDASRIIWDFLSQFDLSGKIGCGTATDLDDLSLLDELNLYPNPSQGVLTIERKHTRPQTFELFSLQGERVYTGQLTAKQTIIELPDLPPSVYLIKVGNSGDRLIKID